MSTKPKYRLYNKPGSPGWAAYREGGNYIIYTQEMVQHPAFVTMSYVCAVFIRYLEAQYLERGGMYNGRLTARYSDVQQPPWALHAHSLKRAIDEAVAHKLVEVTEPGYYRGAARSDAARYRLTYLRTKDHSIQGEREGWERPTDDWKQYQEPQGDAERKRNLKPRKLRVVPS
jgi:hypothetical protein